MSVYYVVCFGADGARPTYIGEFVLAGIEVRHKAEAICQTLGISERIKGKI